MGAVKEVSSAAMPYVILAAVVGGVYLFRNQIAGWITGHLVPDSLKTPANEMTPTGTGDSLLSWWTAETKDLGTGPVDVTAPDTPLSGDPDKSVFQAQMEKWFPSLFGQDNQESQESVTIQEWMDQGNLTPGAYTAPTEPAFAQAVAALQQQPQPSSDVLAIMQKYGVTQATAEAYEDMTWGLNFRDWLAKVRQEPTFQEKVGLSGQTYQELYQPNTLAGVYLGPNLNPLVPQNDPDYTTIYNPSSGAMWSGSSASTSYLMGDSPEASAWRERYL